MKMLNELNKEDKESIAGAKKLLVFSDDWGRHPSSSQHLIKHLFGEWSITWVNTIGMRPPRLDLMTLKRGGEKIFQWMGIGKKAQNETNATSKELNVIDAKMWPWMTHSWDRALNNRLLIQQLKEASRNAVILTTLPIVVDLIGKLPAKKWTYYCVDDFSAWPGLDNRVLRKLEDQLINRVDDIVVVGETLANRIRSLNREATLLTHGVDIDFWKPKQKKDTLNQDEPIALFWGVIDKRMNCDWLLALADQLRHGRIELAGPTQNPDERILNHPKIRLLGAKRFEDLPKLARKANVLIMPYANLSVTRAMQPLKLKEYLATLKPVVAAKLPAVEPLQKCLDMVDNEHQFIQTTLAYMDTKQPTHTRYLSEVEKTLATESWAAKASIINTVLQKPRNGQEQ